MMESYLERSESDVVDLWRLEDDPRDIAEGRPLHDKKLKEAANALKIPTSDNGPNLLVHDLLESEGATDSIFTGVVFKEGHV